jgi:spermidine synthase
LSARIISRIPFLLFFLSGFCGLLYQVVWLRLAFRSFGVITPVLSVVLSVFMMGLAIGSWAGGRWIARLCAKTNRSPIIYYAIAEFIIGIGAFVVPWLFSISEGYLLGFGEMDSVSYLLISALLIAVSILPWCTLMGVTFPFMMAFLKSVDNAERTSFSFLYLANVIGAMCGTLITAFVLIELMGFRNTLTIAGLANFTIAIIAFTLARGRSHKIAPADEIDSRPEGGLSAKAGNTLLPIILFTTGFTSMGFEVTWTRTFTPVLRTTVYAFALLLSVYLFATWVGSFLYRRDIGNDRVKGNPILMALLSITAFLPVVINDPRLNTNSVILLATIFPLCAVLGYITPKLIDEYSEGSARLAGRAYAVNILGCIIGPLFASYILLPLLGAKQSMVVLAIPFLIFFLLYRNGFKMAKARGYALAVIAAGVFICSLFFNISYEERFMALDFSNDGVIRRDHTATIASYGEGMKKRLFVNGVGITHMTPITKWMAHWPLLHLQHEPKSALVLCFGMGTTYRSLMSWPIEVTAVELVPSVKDAFPYYYDDAEEIMNDPRGEIIIDDGRRFLKRTRKRFDVITIDPPPPIEAAGSSFLYSRDFYEIVKSRLTDGGILQQWFPGGETHILRAMISALTDAFPYVRVYDSSENWGYHFLASMSPIEVNPNPVTIARRFPVAARDDMMEWNQKENLAVIASRMLKFSTEAESFLETLGGNKEIMITDDRPVNEYFKLRRGILSELEEY